jgi:hypothetical protein
MQNCSKTRVLRAALCQPLKDEPKGRYSARIRAILFAFILNGLINTASTGMESSDLQLFEIAACELFVIDYDNAHKLQALHSRQN